MFLEKEEELKPNCSRVQSKFLANKRNSSQIPPMMAEGVEEAERTFLLKSSDGAEFVVSELEASQSMTIQKKIKQMLFCQKAYGLKDSAIHLGVKSNILAKAVEYIKKHLGTDASGAGTHWGAKFVDDDHETLCDFIIVSY